MTKSTANDVVFWAISYKRDIKIVRKAPYCLWHQNQTYMDFSKRF